MPFLSRTRATFRSAEFGFFGVMVYTRVHVPDACGDPLRAGDFVFDPRGFRHFRTNWLIVGKTILRFVPSPGALYGRAG